MAEIEIKRIESSEELGQIKDWILNKHYIKRWPIAVQEKLGIYYEGKLVGTMIYGIGGRPQQAEDLFDEGTMSNNQIWELQRLYTTEKAKQLIPNLGSISIAKGNSFVRTQSKTKDGKPVLGVVTYADANVGHTGSVYKATNASYVGQQKPRPFFVVTSPNGTKVEARTMGKKQAKDLTEKGYKIQRIKGKGKHKYFYPLGKKQKDRDKLMSRFKVPLYSYPEPGQESREIPNPARQANTQQKISNKSTTEPTSKKDLIRKVMQSKVVNPETKNKILVKTALGYDKNHPAYRTAMGMVNAYSKRFGIKLV